MQTREITVVGDVGYLPLTKGRTALIDADMAGIGREGGRYGRNYAVAKWMGVSPYVVQKIDTDPTYSGALIGKGRLGALRRLDQLMRSGQVEGYVRHPSGFRAMLESLSS